MAIARPEPTNAAPEQADDPRLALEDDPPNAVGDVASADAAHDDAEPAEQPTASDDARSDADAADAEAGAAESPSDDDGAERHEDGDGGMSAAAEPAPAEPITARRARRERMPQEPASSPWSPTPSPQPILIEVSAAAAAREAPAEPTARHAPPPRRTSGRAGAVRDDGDEPVAEATEDAAAQDEASHPTEQATDDSPGDAADEDASPAPDDADASREQPTSRRFARRRIEDPPRRRVRGVVALVALAGVIGWTQRDRLATPASTASPPSAAAHVAARAATTPAVTGTVVANDEVDVVCAAAGTIAKLPFDIGDRVGAGDLVAVIDASAEEAELRKAEAQSAASLALLAQARQNLVATQRKAEADDANARAAVAAAESRARDAAAKSERMAKMLAKRLCSDEEAQSAKELAVQADADLAAARAHVDQVAADALTIEVRRQDVAIAEANANGDEATVDAARRRLAGTRLAAPIAGVVCARPARLGARLDSASPTPLMTIADVSRLFVSVRVPQAEIGRLAVGGAVEIRSPAFPGRVFAGRVDRLGVRGEGGDDGPLFAVRVEAFGDALSSLKPAMDAEVAFTAGPEAAAVARTEVRPAR